MIAAKKIYLFVLIEKPTKKLSILTAIASTITLIIDKTIWIVIFRFEEIN